MIILDRFTYLSGYDADQGIEVSDPYLDSGATAGGCEDRRCPTEYGADGRSMLAPRV